MILVAYHHADARRVLVKVLDRMGFEAAGIASGKEALALMRRQKPRLVFLNGTLEDMSGLDCLQMVRGDPTLADTPVYFMSATSDSREAAERLGVAGYALKPLSIDTLAKVTGDLLREATSQ